MSAAGVRLPVNDEGAAPVTILDGAGRVVRVVPADEFRKVHGVSGRPTVERWRRRRGRVDRGGVAREAIERVAP